MKKQKSSPAMKQLLTATMASLAVGVAPQMAWSQVAEAGRGAQILEMQLDRARHLKELEYQAEVLERQARIAKAQQQIDKTTGLAPIQMSGVTTQNSQIALPRIVELNDSSVVFSFEDGTQGEFVPGQTLPSGHKLESVSMIKGATLIRNGKKVRLNFKW